MLCSADINFLVLVSLNQGNTSANHLCVKGKTATTDNAKMERWCKDCQPHCFHSSAVKCNGNTKMAFDARKVVL